MSMEINSRTSNYQTAYMERLKTEQEKADESQKAREKQKADEAGKAQKNEKTQEAGKQSEKKNVVKDEYISSEKSDKKTTGLYRLGKDENGNPKVLYEDPKKSDLADGKETPEVKTGGPKREPEKCTANTDKVDREIKKLKEEKKQLEQQIQRADDDEKKVRELERKLSQVENELNQKDNDTYRRQHAAVTSE